LNSIEVSTITHSTLTHPQKTYIDSLYLNAVLMIKRLKGKQESNLGHIDGNKKRQKRITASNMRRIMSLKPTKLLQKAVADIAYPKSFTTTATEHGKKYEGVARKLLEHLVGPIEERGLIIVARKPNK